MDRIIESFIEDFKSDYNYGDIDKSKLFENFINYCLISKIYPDRSSLDKINVGGSRNPGIDGLAIMVNDHLVTSIEEVEYFLEATDRLDVDFIFIQSKTSDNFVMSEIHAFLMSVNNFFTECDLRFEDAVLNLKDVKDYIYLKSIKMDRSPILKLYFATTGKWTNDQNLLSAVNSNIKLLNKGSLFSNVKFNPIDGEKIKSIYREIKNRITREIIFDKHTILPKIVNVTESYLGILPAKEFIKLISDEEGELIKTIFYDNVRDFQGFNKVNSEMRSTIEDSSQKDKFLLLNNGITIVSKSINKVGTSFKINDFQVVNGCQTSHVLHFLKHKVHDNVYIPLKLIITDNEDVTNDIIRATNSQTEVKNEAFEILKPFHKKLEEFFLSFENSENKKAYYERRSRQYVGSPIKRDNIVTFATQISSFVAMFLNEPQSTNRYFGELLKSYRNRLFNDNHSLYPYYTSGLTFCIIDSLYKTNILNPGSKRFKYHLMLMFRIRIAGEKLPIIVGKEMDKYCLKLCEYLWDREKAKRVFLDLEKILFDRLNKTSLLQRQAHMLRAFTEELIPTVSSLKQTGETTYVNPLRGFGFIRIEGTENDVWVHYSEIERCFKGIIKSGLKFYFDVYDSDKGPVAKNLEKI
jgi:cold shock CspA family protein